jgi:hypothetical protein
MLVRRGERGRRKSCDNRRSGRQVFGKTRASERFLGSTNKHGAFLFFLFFIFYFLPEIKLLPMARHNTSWDGAACCCCCSSPGEGDPPTIIAQAKRKCYRVNWPISLFFNFKLANAQPRSAQELLPKKVSRINDIIILFSKLLVI